MPRRNRALGKAIDPGGWDAEAPLGRIVLIAHAAFLDAGFVSCESSSIRRLPSQAGSSASKLSLRYSVSEFVLPRNSAASAVSDAAVLRLCAHGKFLILYGYLAGDGSRPITRWACVDALSVAPVISGDLDATARALANEAPAVQLWEEIGGRLCRPLFADIWRRNRNLLPQRFLCLPADLQSAILRRLPAVALAMAECTCTELRDLVAGSELWKAKYMVERRFLTPFELPRVDVDCRSGSWKEMYLIARRSWDWWRPRPRLWDPVDHFPTWFDSLWMKTGFDTSRHHDVDRCKRRDPAERDHFATWFDSLWMKTRFDTSRHDDVDRCKRRDPTELLVRRLHEKKSNTRASDGGSSLQRGSSKRRCRDGAIHSPSARYRWTHR